MEDNKTTKYDSVGGWLSFLCFILIIGTPIRNVFTIYIDYSGTNLYFNQYQGLGNYFLTNSIIIIFLTILSITAGISLLLLKSYAVTLTKTYLSILLLYGIFYSLIPELVGLDVNLLNEIKSDSTKTSISSAMMFGIWFLYLSVSERVEKTFPKLKIDTINPNERNTKLISKPLDLIINLKNFCFNKISTKTKNIKIDDLNSDEIIIASIITATLTALFFGNGFSYTEYFYDNGNRADSSNNDYEVYHFNYLIGIASFIIFGGITYIYLNRKNLKND